MARRLGLWAPVAAYMAAIWFVSAQESLPGMESGWDKVLHLVAYLLLGLLCLRATHGGFGAPRAVPTVIAIGVGVAYGAIDEWHQSMVPGRFPDIGDWVADAAGCVLAVVVMASVARASSRRPDETAEPLTCGGDRP